METLKFKPISVLFLTETVTDKNLLQELYETYIGSRQSWYDYPVHPLNKAKNVVKILNNIGEHTQSFITVCPDEVSAFRYIGEMEGLLDKIGFYRVEQKDGKLVIHDDGHNIEEIFRSLNKVLDYIADYDSFKNRG